MTTETTTTAKMLERVRALLAKADGTNFPAEADSFRAKADQLMTTFAIAQWQVEAAQDGINRRVEPEQRMFNFEWWYRSQHSRPLFSMFRTVAHHCRCVVAYRGQQYTQMPVIGIPSDLDYLDMLFTHLMLQMGKQLEPKPDPDKPFDENAYILRRAGLNRYRVAELMFNATTDDNWMFPEAHKGREEYESYSDLPTYPTGSNPNKSLRGQLRRSADKYAVTNGLDKTTNVNPRVWQRSFAAGFVQEVNMRLRAMREAQERPSDGPSVALAIRDIRDMAVALYEKMYPDPQCKEDGCEEPPVYMGYCEEHCKAHDIKIPKPSRGRALAPLRHSTLAYGAGITAGRKADLAASPQRGVDGGRGALPR